jgi:crotonobetainyl-CoA:carnitine CoA-transferase CaiB-like acyl-CoA transferase
LGITSSHRTKDGKSILLLLMGREKQVKGFQLMGLERLIHDPRFATAEKLMENREPLLKALDEAMKTRDREEWLKIFDQADIPAAPINSLAEAAKQPQAVANEYIVEIDHPLEGRMRVLGLPIKLHKTPGRLGIAPGLGQHTEEVLSGISGYTREEIEQMKIEKII